MSVLLKAPLRPVRNLVITMLANIAACAVLFEIFEDGDHGPIGNFYWAVTTATTTGYGDISPSTLAGRIIGAWLMISSLGLFAVATGQIAAAVIADPHLFSDEEQEELKDDTDDALLLLCRIAEKLGIDKPDSVEEWDEYIKERNRANG